MRRRAGGRSTLPICGLGSVLLGCQIEPFARGLFASRFGNLPAPVIGRGSLDGRSRNRLGGGSRLRVLIGLSKSDVGHRTIPSAATAKQEACENRCDHTKVHSTAISKTHITLASRPGFVT